jgi:hypothetical protein
MSNKDPRRPRVKSWITDLVSAGDNMDKAKKVFNAVRDDKDADDTDREHFYRALAQQSFLWYMGALKGEPLSPTEIKTLQDQVKAAAQSALDAAANPNEG